MFVLTLKRCLTAICVALLLTGGAVRLVDAQTATPAPVQQTPSQPTRQQYLDALARRLGITTAQLEQAISGARQDVGLPANAAPHRGRSAYGMEAAAQAIGITPEQLHQELPGKSLAQVAQAHGKNPTDVATALKNAANQRIDQAVTAGRLTADQANQRTTQVDQHIDQLMNRVVPAAGAAAGG
jgi:DNA-binding transcriptional regulator YdaS (Cro superfamily)